MLLPELRKELPTYEIDPIGSSAYAALYALEQSNTAYYRRLCGHEVNWQYTVRSARMLPTGASPKQKQLLGFYRDGRLLAAIDFFEGWPQAGTVFVPFFMVHSDCQHKGFGTMLIHALFRVAWSAGYDKVSLRCRADNLGALAFWHTFGLTERPVPNRPCMVLFEKNCEKSWHGDTVHSLAR